MANLIRETCRPTKLYQNQPRLYNKNILVCFWYTVVTAVHLQNTNAKFHKVE